ncbi:MAG: hypothetical protein FJY55_10960 [Betaproteobacteria bacterium]|nr:hypothetical protein [Betaproteobacteria bacterium]
MRPVTILLSEARHRWRTTIAAAGLTVAAALAAGCASYSGSNLVAGRSTAAEVESSMGAPAEKVTEANGDAIWFYPRGPAGRRTYAVRTGQDGIVRGVEQRLTADNIAKLVVDRTTAQETRALFGPPTSIRYYSRVQRHMWEYNMTDGDNQFSTTSFKLLALEFSGDNVLRKITYQDDFNDLQGHCREC